jgi:hypothetical protein
VSIEIVFTRRVAVLGLVVLALTAGCRRKDKGLSSMVSMADPSTATQLVSGFHAVESGAWRWTMKKFSIVLKPPQGADQNGATLRVRLFVSDDQINRLGPITLSAEVNGVQLEPQTYSKPGDTAYSRTVPADVLKGASVKVNFSLDKAREPDNVDGRQLGVVASVIGLQPR